MTVVEELEAKTIAELCDIIERLTEMVNSQQTLIDLLTSDEDDLKP